MYNGVVILSRGGGGGDFIKNIIATCHKDANDNVTIPTFRYTPVKRFDDRFYVFQEHVRCFGGLNEFHKTLQQSMWNYFGLYDPSKHTKYFNQRICSKENYNDLFNVSPFSSFQLHDNSGYLSIYKKDEGYESINPETFFQKLKTLIDEYNLKTYMIDFSNKNYILYSYFVYIYTHIFMDKKDLEEAARPRYKRLLAKKPYKMTLDENLEYIKLLNKFYEDHGIEYELLDINYCLMTRDFKPIVDQIAKSYPLDKYLSQENIDIINDVWDERIYKMKQMNLWLGD